VVLQAESVVTVPPFIKLKQHMSLQKCAFSVA